MTIEAIYSCAINTTTLFIGVLSVSQLMRTMANTNILTDAIKMIKPTTWCPGCSLDYTLQAE
jgi:hypothetical protein